MKRKALLTAFIITIFTGCKVNQPCEAYSHQCDELYSDYNCDLQRITLSTPQYPTTYVPVPRYYSNNAYYYNNVYIENNCDVPNSPPIINGPRPSIYHTRPSETPGNVIENNSNGVHRKPRPSASSSQKKRD